MKKTVLWACGFVCAMLPAVQADIINTWTGGTGLYGSYFNGIAPPFCQTFTVLEGQTGTQFEFLIEKGASTDPNKGINIAVWSGGTLMGLQSTKFADPVWGLNQWGVPNSTQWIGVSGLNLAPGVYIGEMWATGGDANTNTYLYRSTTSTYEGGEARTDWHPGTPIGANNDFAARVTVVPEPMTILMLVGGVVGMIWRRK